MARPDRERRPLPGCAARPLRRGPAGPTAAAPCRGGTHPPCAPPFRRGLHPPPDWQRHRLGPRHDTLLPQAFRRLPLPARLRGRARPLERL